MRQNGPEHTLDPELQATQRRLRRKIDQMIDTGELDTPEKVADTLGTLATILWTCGLGPDEETARGMTELAYQEATLKDM
jgi:hypothetical protein